MESPTGPHEAQPPSLSPPVLGESPPSSSESAAVSPAKVSGARPFREWSHTLSTDELNEFTESTSLGPTHDIAKFVYESLTISRSRSEALTLFRVRL
jgi:hypothetical protein